MIGPQHSQLVPTSPIWSQVAPTSTKKSGIQLPSSGCIQNPRDVQLLMLPTFQNYDVVFAMVCASPRANTSKTHHVLHSSWQLPVLIDGVCLTYSSWTRQKSWTCPYCVSSMRNRKVSKTVGFVTFWWNTLCATKLETQPNPTQMLR